jgi:tetratricopeptide (TPR) repeat protein
MAKLADAYRNQGKYCDADTLYQHCIDLMKEVIGESHPRTLFCMSNFATCYYYQGKFSDAEVLFKQCLDKQKVALGENHPDTLSTMNSLALLSQKSVNKI